MSHRGWSSRKLFEGRNDHGRAVRRLVFYPVEFLRDQRRQLAARRVAVERSVACSEILDVETVAGPKMLLSLFDVGGEHSVAGADSVPAVGQPTVEHIAKIGCRNGGRVSVPIGSCRITPFDA